MSKKKCLIIAGIMLAIAVVFMFLAYFMFHYLTPQGWFGPRRESAAKPLVTYMISGFSLLNYFGSLVFLLIGLVHK